MLPGSAVVDSLDARRRDLHADRRRHLALRARRPAAPGEARLVRMRVHGAAPATVDVNAIADADADGYLPNNSAGGAAAHRQRRRPRRADGLGRLRRRRRRHRRPGDGAFGRTQRGHAARRSTSISTPPASCAAAWIHEGADCTLLSATRARCTLPALARGAQLFVNYRASFAEPGTYDVKFTLQHAGRYRAAATTR